MPTDRIPGTPIEKRDTVSRILAALHRRIVGGKLKAGTPLPAERELAAELEVSRFSLREALRVAESQGLVEISRGKRTRVVVDSASSVVAAMDLTLRRGIASPLQLTEARLVVEVEVARRCRRRRRCLSAVLDGRDVGQDPRRSHDCPTHLVSGESHIQKLPAATEPGRQVEGSRVTVPEIDRHVAPHGELGAFLASRFKEMRADHFAWSRVLWDVATIAWLLDPAWVPSELVPSPVVTDQVTWSVDRRRHPIRCASFVHRDPIFRDLFRKLAAAA